MFQSLQQRNLTPELMDDPNLDSETHRKALDGLKQINRMTRAYQPLWAEIEKLASNTTPVSILDVGCGGGDALAAIGKLARRARLNIDLNGLDISPTAISKASEAMEAAKLNAGFVEADIVNEPPPGNYDIVFSSLFLHHLDLDDAVTVVRRMNEHSHRLVLISDLLRTSLGYLYAVVGTRLLSRSHIVHVDGPLSVKGAFSESEVISLCDSIGISEYSLQRFWPERFLLKWCPFP